MSRSRSEVFRLSAVTLLSLLVWLLSRGQAHAAEHYDFTYPDRNSFLSNGWGFRALTATGAIRNTEQTAGAVVSYDQIAHPGILRIPADVGDLWGNLNNTRNSLFRNLPSNWTSVRLKLAFAPNVNYQQAGLLVYQDDDNYVQITRIYENGPLVTFARETYGNPTNLNSTTVSATTLYLRLDRSPSSDTITAYYSLDGTTWTSQGSVTQSLTEPFLAIVVGASPSGFPNADLSWVEVMTDTAPPPAAAFSLYPGSLIFRTVAGSANPSSQTVNLLNSGASSITWTAADNASWLSVSPAKGGTPGVLSVSVNAAGLAAGVYEGSVTVTDTSNVNSPQTVAATLIVNPNTTVSVWPWKDGKQGALSISVDDSQGSCYDELTRNGFRGTYFANGTTAPSFYTAYYNAGMELGSHLAVHECSAFDDNTLREYIDSNVQGICATTPQPCDQLISLAWPCGFNTLGEQRIASDYFLSSRGYNYNLLEEQVPADFQDLKSFNSHEHTPYPPSDLKTVVDSAVQQGKWANLVFHTTCDDDGAIDYAAGRDIWVAPIGTVIKYILQAERFALSGYRKHPTRLPFRSIVCRYRLQGCALLKQP